MYSKDVEGLAYLSQYLELLRYELTHCILLLLLCSHSPYKDPPEPQRSVSIAAVRGAMRLSNIVYWWSLPLLYVGQTHFSF